MIFFCLETLSSIMKLVVFPNGLKSQWHIPADAFLNICKLSGEATSRRIDAFENLEMIEIASNCNHSSIDFVISLSIV